MYAHQFTDPSAGFPPVGFIAGARPDHLCANTALHFFYFFYLIFIYAVIDEDEDDN